MRSLKYIAVLPLAVLALGCGPKSDSPGVDGKVSSSSSGPKAGWKLAESKGAGVSFEVPETWQTIDFTAGDFSKLLDDMSKGNPNMARMVPQLKSLAASGKFKMFVVDKAEVDKGQFATNANVILEDKPAGATPDQLMEANKAMIKQMAKGVEPSVTKTTLPGGEAYLMESSLEFPSPAGGTYKTYSAAYMFFRGDKIATITFTGLKDREAEAKAQFKKMADTIKFK
jgi:hypothetical protein